jgi:hypothetical protein
MDNTKDKMVGRKGIFGCSCCGNDTVKKERRANKRRERQAWKKAIR